MRSVDCKEIEDAVRVLCVKASYALPEEVILAMQKALACETSEIATEILQRCLENYQIAAAEKIPLCQDTGFAVFFVELGAEVSVTGGLIEDAVNRGTGLGYGEGFLRASIVADPVFDRRNTGNNTPAVVHIKAVPGDRVRITHAPKGAGSESMSALKMLNPACGEEGVIRFVTETVVNAEGNPCPPVIVGVGIGGTFEKCALLAKEAILRPLGQPNSDRRYALLEEKILAKINASGVGPQGLGGKSTALAVHINPFPCHIAMLPVAVNINCHAARHATVVI